MASVGAWILRSTWLPQIQAEENRVEVLRPGPAWTGLGVVA